MNDVLIVDDDNELRAILCSLLRDKGYRIDEASSGMEAIEKAALKKFDIVLLDLVMPNMSGMDALQEIRKISPFTKVIMLTSFASISTSVDAIRKGASDYIAKPVRIDDLDIVIKRNLEESRFDAGAGNTDLDDAMRSLSNHIRRGIIKLIDSTKGIRLMDISRTLDIDDHTKVSFHLKILKESGLIEQKKKSYVLTKQGSGILGCLRIMENLLLK